MAVTWHDILKFTGIGGDEIVSDVKVSCPEFTGVDRFGTAFDIARGQTTLQGDTYTAIRRIESTRPDVFKQMNQGVAATKGNYVQSVYKIAPAGYYCRVDKDFVRIDPARGAAYMKAEAVRMFEDLVRQLGVQFFYGQSTDATVASASENGFQGIQALVDGAQTFSAGGTVSGTSTLTSAYMVRFNAFNGVSWLFGQGGELSVGDIKEVPVFEDEKAITYLMQEIKVFPGVACNSVHSLGRIANIPTTTASTPGSISTTAFTDEHIMLALEKMRDKPDVIFMSTKAGILLGASRVNTVSFKGASLKVAPFSLPIDCYGIPICYTDSISNGESAWSAS